MTQFKKDDRVIYVRGEVAESVGLSKEVWAKVTKVSVGDGVMRYSQPLYHIEWPPTGYAVVYAKSLRPMEKTNAK